MNNPYGGTAQATAPVALPVQHPAWCDGEHGAVGVHSAYLGSAHLGGQVVAIVTMTEHPTNGPVVALNWRDANGQAVELTAAPDGAHDLARWIAAGASVLSAVQNAV